MTIAPDAFLAQAAEPEPERDRWGRYLIVDPDTGKKVARQRVTTFAKILADTYNLERWSQRMTAKGLANRADLLAQVAAASIEDKDTLNRIVEEAKEAAGSSVGRNLGSALHSFTERIDRGEPNVVAPAPLDLDLDAYRQAMTAAGVKAIPGLIERVVVVPAVEVAGTFDRILTCDQWALPRIGDVKSAQEMYGWLEVAIQLACYAHATSIYDLRDQTHQPMPEVDQEVAVVMHLPAGKGTCTLYEVDITAGWEMAQIAAEVRDARKRKDFARVLTQATLSATAPAGLAEHEGQGTGGSVGTPDPAPRPLGLVASGLARRIDAATLEQQLEMSAAVQAAGLPRLSLCPPERLPEWVALVNGVLGEQIGAKRSVRFDRVTMANRARELTPPQGIRLAELLATHGLVRLTETADEDLERWEELLRQVELDLDVDDDPFVGLPSANGVHQPDSKHPDLQARYHALPVDLRLAVDAAKGDLPNLRFADATPEQLQRATELITAAEADYEKRKAYAASLLQDLDEETVAVLVGAAGDYPLETFTETDVERLEDLCAALDAGLVLLTYDGDDAVLVTSDAALDAAVEAQGSKQAALSAAKEIARAAGLPAPRSVAAAVETPVIAARLARRAS